MINVRKMVDSFLSIFVTKKPEPKQMLEDNGPPVVVLREDDWRDLCVVMRSLTWGKGETMDTWHRLRERVNARNNFPTPKDSERHQ